jgi:hypothetical protein
MHVAGKGPAGNVEWVGMWRKGNMRVRRLLTFSAALALIACNNNGSDPIGPGDNDPPLGGGAQLNSVIRLLVNEPFARVEPFGWGSATVGGNWLHSQPARFSIDGNVGIVTLNASRPENVVLDGGFGTDVGGITRFSVDRAPDGGGFHTIQVYARRDDRFTDGDNYYRFRVRLFQASQFGRMMDVRLEKNVNGWLQFLTPNIRLNTTFDVNRWYWLRWEAFGSNPTTLRMKVWAADTAEPSEWTFEERHTEPRLNVEGSTGYRLEGPSNHTSWPVRIKFSELRFAEIAPY